jgi:type VI secretion system protein ImpG
MVTQRGGTKTFIEVPPYHSLRHDEAVQPATIFWVAHHDRWSEDRCPGYETTISFVGIDAQPLVPGGDQVEIGLICHNSESVQSLPVGDPDGDLFNEDASFACTVSLLHTPTQSTRASQRNGALWRLMSQITPNHLSLDVAGLKAMLHQHATTVSGAAARRMNGIIALEYRPAMKWMPVTPLPTFVRGVEVILTIDEHAFAGASLAMFIGVMDRFFAPYTHRNSFVQLVIVNADGGELFRCDAREGGTPLIRTLNFSELNASK